MPKITFAHPEFEELTVYVPAASHKKTILSVAKQYKVPIKFECEDGECGSCAIRVTNMEGGLTNMGAHLTEKEKNVLREIGKISREDMERVIVDDIPTEWRLACQMIVRDEDIRVEYPKAE